MKRFIPKTLALLAIVTLAACNDNIDFEYSDYHCNLTIDNSVHLDPTLASAMSPLSPGVFTTIKPLYKNSLYYFEFKNNQGLSSEKRFNAIDERLNSQRRVGLNNGIIVGYGNLDNPARFFAFDLQCPNCFNPSSIPIISYELSVNGAGIATCKNCKRTYNLNTGGNIVSGNSSKSMSRYRAQSGGPNGILQVY